MTTQEKINHLPQNKDWREELENLFENMEHFIPPYDERRFEKFIQNILTELYDEAVGKEQKTTMFRGDIHGLWPKGVNFKRQQVIEAFNKFGIKK